MTRLIFVFSLLAVGLLAGPDACAQRSRRGPSQTQLEGRKKKKLAEPFLKNARWITDYDAAKQEARRSGKLIFAYFTRSYAP